METLFTIVGWLNKIGVAGLLIALVLGAIAAFVKAIRERYGFYLYALSYLLGITMWLLCVVVLHDIWGYTGIIIGVLLAGLGVIPLCLLAVSMHGQWFMLGSLMFSLFLIFACRLGGMALMEKAKIDESGTRPTM